MLIRTLFCAAALWAVSAAAHADPITVNSGWLQVLNVGADVDIPGPHGEFLYYISEFPAGRGEAFSGDTYTTDGLFINPVRPLRRARASGSTCPPSCTGDSRISTDARPRAWTAERTPRARRSCSTPAPR